MVKFELDRDKGILIVSLEGPLEAGDFQAIAREIDPYLAAHGRLTGLMIQALPFHGWRSLGALVQHLKFVLNHHRQIKRVAAVTDSLVLRVVPRIVGSCASPEIRAFGGDQALLAFAWLESGNQP